MVYGKILKKSKKNQRNFYFFENIKFVLSKNSKKFLVFEQILKKNNFRYGRFIENLLFLKSLGNLFWGKFPDFWFLLEFEQIFIFV